MSANSPKAKAIDLLAQAGITVNGKNPGDIQVHNEEFYARIFREGSLGLGESYMDGWWDAEPLDDFFFKGMYAHLEKKVKPWGLVLAAISARLINRQSKSRSKTVAIEHYDIGNDLYSKMLGKWMQYTCGYWKNATDLDTAQEHKLDLVCRKLELKPGEKVLELGCGFGGFARFATERYGVEVTAYNISKEQLAYARNWCKGFKATFVEADYRDAVGQFDKVVSIGLCEHVGYKNYGTFMEVANRCLKPGGLFLLHTIGGNKSRTSIDPWYDKYIFPGAQLPSVEQLASAAQPIFMMEDWHNFGVYYDPTLVAWFNNFNAAWPELKGKYSDRFYRMWKFYLFSSAALFRSREAQLWQIVFSKGPRLGGYTSIR